ncbi:MAG: hypothetical protein ACLS3Q_09445 [Lachnospira sp.]
MTNYEQMKELLQAFADNHNHQVCIEAKLSKVSEDKAETRKNGNRKYIYKNTEKDMDIIDMDEIAHNVYRLVRFPDSTKESESLASADAFVISADNIWYFIEFKNQQISKTKESVTKKAYQNWFWLVDVLYEMREKKQMQYSTFNYDNPITFAKENVVYILVVSEEKNMMDIDKIRKCILAGEKFQPEYMKKLEKYIFKEAYVYTPDILENEFVKHFKY